MSKETDGTAVPWDVWDTLMIVALLVGAVGALTTPFTAYEAPGFVLSLAMGFCLWWRRQS